MMAHTTGFVANHRIQIDILHALKDITFHKWIGLLQFCDQLLHFHSLGTSLLVIAGGTGICKFAGTLDEMQMVIVSPGFDIILADQVQRTDQLHSLKICAVKLRHHGLYLGTVKHPH